MDNTSATQVFPLSLLYENEQKLADQVYLRQPFNHEWHEYTWKDTMAQVRRIVTFLHQQGLEKGDRVAIFSKNCAHWFIADFAIMMAGMISVPLYATQKHEDISYILKHSEAKLIFVGKLDQWELQEGAIPEGITRVSFPYMNSMPADYQWNDIIESCEPLQGNPSVNLNDIMTIIYTSGTTGTPKGVVYSYKTISTVRPYIDSEMKSFGLPVHNHFISYLPLAHVVERIAIELLSLGSPGYTFDVSFVESLSTFPDDLREVSPTLFFAVPRIWAIFQKGILEKIPQKKLNILLKIPFVSALIKRKIKKALGFSRCVYFVSGAAPLSTTIIEFFAKLDIEICEGYGLTENNAYVSLCKPSEMKLGSVGKARPGVEIKLSDNKELLVKSPGDMECYYKDGDLTGQSRDSDGFLKTGDLARIDEDGYVYIIGRNKDQFKTAKGEYIVPVPIEMSFAHNNLIEMACLVGTGLKQPVLLTMLSVNAKKLPNDQLKKSFKKLIDEENQHLVSHEKVSHMIVVKDDWTPENGLLTPTLKIKRNQVEQHYADVISKTQTSETSVLFETNL